MIDCSNNNADDAPCPLMGAVSRWTRRKEARPAEILDAALDLFVARGFAATKMEDIARAAGVTAGTLYRYFGSKEAILKAVIAGSLAPTLAEGEKIMRTFTGTGGELLTIMIRAWWLSNGETRLSGIPKLMMAEAGNFPDIARFHRESVILPAEQLLGRAIQYGIDRGDFRPIAVEVAVKVVVAPVLMAMLWKHTSVCDGMQIDIEHYLDEVITTLIRGLGTQP